MFSIGRAKTLSVDDPLFSPHSLGWSSLSQMFTQPLDAEFLAVFCFHARIIKEKEGISMVISE